MLWVFGYLLWRHGSAVVCHGGRGSCYSRSGRHGVWVPPQNHWAENLQSEEQLHQRSFHRVAKVLEPTVDFLIWGSSKETKNPRESDYEGQWNLIIKLPQNWGERLLEDTNKTLCTAGPRRKEQWPHRRLSQTCLWVSRSLWQRDGLKVACRGISGTDYNSLGISPFEGVWPQAKPQKGNTVTPINKKIGFKTYWAWPSPSEQDPDSPTASPYHQEASTSLILIHQRADRMETTITEN